MIDLHCHILPNIDDGPSTIEGAVAMCRMALDSGIKTIVATPHFKPEFFTPPERDAIVASRDLLMQETRRQGIDITILLGAEVRVTTNTINDLKDAKILTLNHNGRYFLAEFSRGSLPDGWQSILSALMEAGYVPVIAHPERNFFFQKNPYSLARMIKQGALVQVTAESLTGAGGAETVKFCEFLLREGLVHVIATDSHSTLSRPPRLCEALDIASSIIGKDKARALVTTIPEAIINGQDIEL